MIERGFDNEVISALQNSEVAVLLFVDIDWPGGRVRAHTGLGTREFQGQTYLGVGEFGGVSEVVEAANNSPNQIRITLKVLDAGVVGLVMNNSPEGREVAIHMAVLDENRVFEHEVPYVVDGNVASFDIQRGDLSKDIPYVLQITCTDWFERWSRPPESAKTTDSAQQHLHPGDRFFDLTEVIAAAPLSSMPIKNITRYGERFKDGIL